MSKVKPLKINKGDRFSCLVVIDNYNKPYKFTYPDGTKNNESGRNYFRKCRCDCGNIIYRTESNLRVGIGSGWGCGKWHKTTDEEDQKEALRIQVRTIKNAVLLRKIGTKWNLTDEQTAAIITKNCFYCNSSPSNESLNGGRFHLNGRFFCNGIDRLDPKVGYNPLNCVPCCKECNFMKRNMTLDEFMSKIISIYERIKLQYYKVA